ncbi:AraC family transcriptional regulator ligand-binding domain-containing protein [Undibacterium squillarum]|uniref:AraC family transcriptional regulator ligand-binding domain-containing protein n=1 Tax=Undibacterium squillarum TaxID=1131567 RepID=UPI0035B0E8F6
MPSLAPWLSVSDPVFPVHAFAGLQALSREQGWQFQLPADSGNGTARISYQQARGVLTMLQARYGRGLALWSGSRKALPQLSYLAEGLLAQATLGEALQFAMQFQRVAGAMTGLHAGLSGQHLIIRAEALFADPELEDFLALDHLTTALMTARQLGGAAVTAQRLELRCRGLSEQSALEQLFGCRIVFGADENRIVLPAGIATQEIRKNAPAPAAQAKQRCEMAIRELDGVQKPTLLQRISSEHWDAMTAAAAAESVHMSERAFHRALAREGVRFAVQTEQLRMQKARAALLAGESSELLAERLGYADERSFRRAFQRVHGLSPAQYRRLQAASAVN